MLSSFVHQNRCMAKAEKEGRKGKVKALQRILTSSFYAKCLAVKRLTSSIGCQNSWCRCPEPKQPLDP
jgi:hypothetical protein